MAGAAKAGSLLIPSFRYRDAHAAIAWLERVFGFTRHAVYDGPENTVAHAELAFGTGMIMLGSYSNESPNARHWAHPDEIGNRITSPMYLIVPDAAAVYARVQEAGTEILMELQDMGYGGKAFACRDLEGYNWSVGEYDPWAATS